MKMILFKPLDFIEKKYSIDFEKEIGKGSCGKIYRLEKGVVAKIPFDFHKGILLNDKLSQRRIYEESKIQSLAFEMGIRFPEVYGLYSIKEKNSGVYFPGLCMKDLGDMTVNKLSGIVLKEAERQRDLEIKKAKELGFKIKDAHDMNAIWFEEKTYLLDAGIMEFRSEIL